MAGTETVGEFQIVEGNHGDLDSRTTSITARSGGAYIALVPDPEDIDAARQARGAQQAAPELSKKLEIERNEEERRSRRDLDNDVGEVEGRKNEEDDDYGDSAFVLPTPSKVQRERFPAKNGDADPGHGLGLGVTAKGSGVPQARSLGAGRSDAVPQVKRSSTAKPRRRKTSPGARTWCEWAYDEHRRYFPAVVLARLTVKEYGQAAKLIELYGGDIELVSRAWTYCCEHWPHLQSKLKSDDAGPTIGLLLGFRARIFPAVQQPLNRAFQEKGSASPTGTFSWW